MSVYEATSNAAATLLAPFSGSCHQPPWLLSPDGDWLAANCFPNLEVVTRDGTSRIVISYDDVYADLPEWPCAFGLVPLHWTRDDQTLFFSREESCFDGAVVAPMADYLGPLYRLDIQTGQWTQIVVGQIYSSFYYSFSPTDRRLAYSQVYGAGRLPAIRILDLKTGELEIVEIPEFNELGGVTWSPDGLSFAFVSMKYGENYTDESIRYSVFIYDIPSASLTKIISETPERRIPQEWTADDVLVIPLARLDASFGTIPGQTIYYDLRTKFFSPLPLPHDQIIPVPADPCGQRCDSHLEGDCHMPRGRSGEPPMKRMKVNSRMPAAHLFHRFYRWFALPFLLAALLLAGCGAAPKATTATSTPLPTRTRTAWPSATSSPTIDPTLQAWADSRDATWEALIQVVIPATQTAEATEVAPFPGHCQFGSYMVSPDGNWLAQSCGMVDGLVIGNLDGSRRWQVTNKQADMAFGANPFGMQLDSVYPYQWSADSHYLYFSLSFCCADYAPSVVLYGLDVDQEGHYLYKLDILTGTYTQFVARANYYSFSPTGRRLVYIRAADVTVRDLRTGEESEYRLEGYVAASQVVWSEDGTQFVFVATQRQSPAYQYDCPLYFNYSLYLADLNAGTLTQLYTYLQSEVEVIPIDWGTSDVITIRTEGSYCQVDYEDNLQFFSI